MWSFISGLKNQQLFSEAQLLQGNLLNLSLSPIQKAFADVSLPLLNNRELRQYILLAHPFNNVSENDLTHFLDKLYIRLYPKSSPQPSTVIDERIMIRCLPIGVLLLLINGFHNINYYSIASFGVLFGSLLLFWQECKKRAYWTISITMVVISVYNPIYKAHFTRLQWVLLDRRLITALGVAILIDFLITFLKKIKRPQFSSLKTNNRLPHRSRWHLPKFRLKTNNRLLHRSRWHLPKFRVSKNVIVILWYGGVIAMILGGAYLLWPNANRTIDYTIPPATVKPVRSGNLVSDSDTHTSYMPTLNTVAADPYEDWDAVAYKTGSRPAGFKFKSQYGSVTNKLTVTAGSELDAVVRLVNTKTGKCVRYVFIQAGDSFDIRRIPLGEYKIKIAMGKNWKQKLVGDKIFGLFTEHAIYEKGNEVLSFYIAYGKISVYSLKLNQYTGTNNFESSVISEDEFNQ